MQPHVAPPPADGLADLFAQRVENLYAAQGLCCAEAILLACSRGLGPALPDETAISLGSGLCGGMGGGESVCGALSGAVIGIGHTLGAAGLSRRTVRKAAQAAHDEFTRAHGSIICRDLTDQLRRTRTPRRRGCGAITRETARSCVRIILQARPGLLGTADLAFLQTRETRASGFLRKLRSLLPGGLRPGPPPAAAPRAATR